MSKGLVRFPGVGCVVEFLQGNAPQIAWVLEEQGGRLRLLLPNRRETNLQAARLLPWIGPGYPAAGSRDAAIEILEKHRIQRETLAAGYNPVEWWELAQGEVEKAGAEWFADLIATREDADVVAAVGRALMGCKTHFRFQPPEFEIWPQETVVRRINEQENAARQEKLIHEGGAFVRSLWDAFSRQTPPPSTRNMDEGVLALLRETLLARLGNFEETEHEALWKQVTKGLPEDPYLPLYLAQGWGLVGPHHNVWFDRAGYDGGNAWADIHAPAIKALRDRATLEGADAGDPDPRTFLSIDAATTRDIDDAFHIESLGEGNGWRLTLALACPAACWDFDSDLDRAVQRRATSIYLPEGTSHMLPETLGADAFSLMAKQIRPAMLVQCEVSAQGQILSCAPSFGHVCLTANLTYDACEAALQEQESAASPYVEQLRMGLELAQVREAHRVENGAVIIARPDLRIELPGEHLAAYLAGEREVDILVEPDESAPQAHLMVAEHMVLANTALARWAGEHDLPLLHRTQHVNIPKEYAGVWSDPVDVARVVRLLAPACLETTPRPHAGVGEAAYAPSTSPLRRYPDFINEAQILHMFRHGTPRWKKEELDAWLVFLNTRLEAAGLVQRQRPRYWKLLYFKKRPDAWWSGVITDENDALVTVNVPHEQLVVRGRRNLFGERTTIGQEVEVRLGKIRPLNGEISIIEVREL